MAYFIAILSLCVTSIVSVAGGSEDINLLTNNRDKRSIKDEVDDTKMSSSYKLAMPSYYDGIEGNVLRLPDLSMYKRVPMGFTGMRGKKDYEYSDFSGRPFEADFDNFKRAPNGFLGVRGKKDYLDFLNDYDENLSVENEIYPNEIKELIYNPLLYGYDQQTRYNGNNQFESKRAPSNSFFGMRGKKSNREVSSGKELVNVPNKMESAKRAPNGFLGMRGKKDDGSLERLINVKRSALTQFFGTRGKKQPLNSGFFGMRGKKQPFFGLRGKFVAVRGKKTISNESLQRLDNSFHLNDDNGNTDEEDANDEHGYLNRLITTPAFTSVALTSLGPGEEETDSNGKDRQHNENQLFEGTMEKDINDMTKRAPSGFVGMRGKKTKSELSHFQG